MKKVITVDFDDTLTDSAPVNLGWGWSSTGSMNPIKRVCDFVHKLAKEGNELHIVTFRCKETSKTEVEDFVKKHKLPIAGVVYTCMKPKIQALKKLKSTLHIDDDVETCLLAYLAGIDVLLVDHGQHKDNETAKLFKRI